MSPVCGTPRLRTLNTIDDVERRQLQAMYNKLQELPTERLMDIGMKWFNSGAVSDSAVLCFVVVGNRYHEKMSLDDKKACIQALISGAHITSCQYYDYKLSYELLSKAIEIIDKDKRLDNFLLKLYLNTGILFMNSGVHYGSKKLVDAAGEYMYKALDEAVDYKDWDIYTKAFFCLSNFFVGQNEIAKLKELLDRRNYSIVPNDIANYKAFQFCYYGMQALDNGDYDKARRLFREEAATIKEIHNPKKYEVLTALTVGRAFEMENKIDSAIAVYQQLLPEARRAGIIDVVGIVYSFLYEAYKLKDDMQNYMKYYHRYVQLKDTLLTKSGMADVGETYFLNLVKHESDNAERLKERNLNYFIFAFLLTVILIIIITLLLLVSSKNKYLKERNRLLFERAQKVVEVETEETDAADQQKYRSSTLTDEMKIRLVSEIKKLVADSETVCKPNLSISQVAKMLDVNARYVSQTINECFGMNFSMLLAKARVREACLRLGNPEEYGNLTIEAIAQSVGFRSRNSLITAFKKFTGLTPSEYLRVSKERDVE